MKSLLKLTLISLITLTASFSAFAQNWKHLKLKSRESTEINLDYRILSYSYYGSVMTRMQELYLHVSRNDLRPEDQIRVVLLNYPFYEPNRAHIKTFDLKHFGENHFMLQTFEVDMNIFNGTQELAVVINGVWQKVDWNSDNSNFRFQLVPYIQR
jgi:hypothetical protein